MGSPQRALVAIAAVVLLAGLAAAQPSIDDFQPRVGSMAGGVR
jgi:hypothetical protein